MIGSNGERMLAATLPHVDRWNTWYAGYGNTAEGFAELNASISAAAERAARDPAEVERSACVLVELEGDAVKRPRSDEGLDPVTPDGLREHLRALEEAGADEAILILRPITEQSIEAIGSLLSA
jgi:alkanesulfonate monooxygenase SsuD/methylene tetrahydromethanopterin reductase-like flavin-dependent oxidoreductase (luciferase family)